MKTPQLLDSLRIRSQLLLVLAVPLVGLSILAAWGLRIQAARVSEAGMAGSLVVLTERAGGVLHMMQRERGATSVNLSSGGTRFQAELADIRKSTDTQLGLLREYLDERADDLPAGVRRTIEAASAELDRLVDIRASVDTLDIETAPAIAYYTSSNSKLLESLGSLATSSPSAEIGRMSSGLVAFMHAKEKSGIERAKLASIFARDEIDADQLASVSGLLSAQASFFTIFQTCASDETLAKFVELEKSTPFLEVARLESLVLGQTSGFGIDSTECFKTITKKIDGLKQVEDFQQQELHERIASLRSSATSDRNASIALVALCFLFALGLSAIVIRAITQPIAELKNATRLIAEGDLSFSIEHSSSNELGELADGFRTLAGNLRNLARSADQVANGDLTVHVESCGENDVLAHSLQRMASSLRETLEEIQGSSELLSASATEMANMSTQLSDNAEQTANQTQAVATASEEIDASIREITRSAGDTFAATTEAVGETGAASESILRLDDTSRQVNEIVGMISSISEQTNLLALNATIEAARAGESGRGFAVVANEVKDLAAQTGNASGDVSERVHMIQSGSKNAVSVIEQVRERIGDIHDLASGMSAALEQQAATTSELALSIHKISDVAESTSSVSSQSKQAADELRATAESLRSLVAQFVL